MRSDVDSGARKRRASATIRTSLPSTGTTSRNSTQTKFWNTTARSRAMPTVMKKRPSNTSRKGLMSSSTW